MEISDVLMIVASLAFVAAISRLLAILAFEFWDRACSWYWEWRYGRESIDPAKLTQAITALQSMADASQAAGLCMREMEESMRRLGVAMRGMKWAA